MNSTDFTEICSTVFSPFLASLGLSADPIQISGRYYRQNWSGKEHVLSVSFEPSENHFTVIVFGRRNGRITDVDDLRLSPRLADLNRRLMPTVTAGARQENEEFFADFKFQKASCKQMLKYAKELRLVLPLHFTTSTA